MVRGALIAAVIGFAVILVSDSKHAFKSVLILVISAAVVTVFAVEMFPQTTLYWSDFAKTPSGRIPSGALANQMLNVDYRLQLMETGVKLIASSPPFGYGDFSMGGVNPIEDVTNTYVLVGIVSGPIGLLVFAAFIASLSRNLRWRYRRSTTRDDRIFSIALTSPFIVVLLCWLDSSWPGQFTQFAWLFCGLAQGWKLQPVDDVEALSLE
jgi:hypothetical protein